MSKSKRRKLGPIFTTNTKDEFIKVIFLHADAVWDGGVLVRYSNSEATPSFFFFFLDQLGHKVLKITSKSYHKMANSEVTKNPVCRLKSRDSLRVATPWKSSTRKKAREGANTRWHLPLFLCMCKTSLHVHIMQVNRKTRRQGSLLPRQGSIFARMLARTILSTHKTRRSELHDIIFTNSGNTKLLLIYQYILFLGQIVELKRNSIHTWTYTGLCNHWHQ